MANKIDLEQTIKDKQGPRYLLTHKVEKSFTAYAKNNNNDSKTKNKKAKELVTLELYDQFKNDRLLNKYIRPFIRRGD